MRFLIVATAVLACAVAPSSSQLFDPYVTPLGNVAPVPVAPAARLTPAQPTISAGDINGAALELRAEVNNQARAAVDATRQLSDKVSELQGQAINTAEEQGWRAVDVVKTVEARLDGATARDAPVIAKNIVRSSGVAPVPYTAPVAASSYTAPVAAASYTAPVAAPLSYTAPIEYPAAPAYAAGPVYADAPFAYSSPAEYGYSGYPGLLDYGF